MAAAHGSNRPLDLLVHTCAEEPFGLVVLEAFAAGVPVLVPNAGGSASLVCDGDTGFHFAASERFAPGAQAARYAALLEVAA